ncbi:hypothetical protein FACS189459_5620 [Bacilli bacterium]|nr:hypothetical protein FACS189459_5620 [Bacilli bacterium]
MSQYVCATNIIIEKSVGMKSIHTIPALVKPSNVEYKYYNPNKSHSYFPNDYYLDNLKDVNKQIDKSDA